MPGHGLGLAIVERTVAAVGGSCRIFGAPDAGTSVVVRLPRVRAE
jgi:signal transduction histidine kinase